MRLLPAPPTPMDTDSARSRSSRSQDDGCSESSMTVDVVYVPGRKKRRSRHGHRGVRPGGTRRRRVGGASTRSMRRSMDVTRRDGGAVSGGVGGGVDSSGAMGDDCMSGVGGVNTGVVGDSSLPQDEIHSDSAHSRSDRAGSSSDSVPELPLDDLYLH